jgi:lipoprotein-anchoring transpeptidase ErfK/SrfK
MKKFLNKALVAATFSVFAFGAPAKAEVVIDVDLATQTMHVESATGTYDWRVSTARAGFTTPRGHFEPISMERMHYSKKYHNSPMPYSIFFRGGYAIHGTNALSALGVPASHGCVRLSPQHAKMLYEMVQNEGASISIIRSPARYASR